MEETGEPIWRNPHVTFERIERGAAVFRVQSGVYEFTAEQFGLYLFHCHTMPVKMHIARGLYGAFLIDPKTPRPPISVANRIIRPFGE